MKTRACSALALAVVALSAACTSPQQVATGTAMAKCLPDTVSQDTCEYFGPPSNPNKAVCHIYVGGSQDTPVVYPYDLFVSKGVRNNVTIVWTLVDPGASFRDNNDGPNFGNNPEFSQGGTTDDPNGASAPHGHGAKYYSVKFKNSPGGRSHQYSVTFKPASADSVRCDPTITNGGG